jgi:hypothetical protein
MVEGQILDEVEEIVREGRPSFVDNARAEIAHRALLDVRDRALSDRHEGERRKLYENEAFTIGVLQAVCAASAFGIVSQIRTLNRIAGPCPALIALTMLILGLAAAVAAAFFRHQYKMWDVKAAVRKEGPEKARRGRKTIWYLWAMRHSMTASTILVAGSLIFLIGALWITYINRPI